MQKLNRRVAFLGGLLRKGFYCGRFKLGGGRGEEGSTVHRVQRSRVCNALCSSGDFIMYGAHYILLSAVLCMLCYMLLTP